MNSNAEKFAASNNSGLANGYPEANVATRQVNESKSNDAPASNEPKKQRRSVRLKERAAKKETTTKSKETAKEKSTKSPGGKKRKSSSQKTREKVAISKKPLSKTDRVLKNLRELCGIKRPEKVCGCVKAAILKGYIQLDVPKPLEQKILKDKCPCCDAPITVRLKDVLYQSDWGEDYEVGCPGAKIKCPRRCGQERVYVSDICYGNPSANCGKFYHHCSKCPEFGFCLGDYRMMHCDVCNDHYHGIGGPCYNCEKGADNDDDDFVFPF